MIVFQMQTFVFRNRSGAELELALEPEGDVIVLPLDAHCEISADDGGPKVRDLEIDYGAGRITVYASCTKRVVVGGVRVR
jgi:hypothetical protein